MKKMKAIKDQQLLDKLIQGGRTNLSKWFEKITDEFCNEKSVEERNLVETIQKKFYTDLTEKFLCSLPTLLFKFLIEKWVGHIVKPHPLLCEPPQNSNWAEKQKKWEKFIAKREWEYFLRKWTELSEISKASGRQWGDSWSYVRVKWRGF